jgi:predicted outer membrane lipoprotein
LVKAGTQNHVKVKRLKRLLGIPLYRAVGILETLWLLCTDCCDEGNIGKFSHEEIADYLEWDGQPSELIAGLAGAGWIDADPERGLIVHDWLEHCPEFIRDRVRKREARRNQTTYERRQPDNTGQTPDKPRQRPSIPIQCNSIPSHSNQLGAADAANVIDGPEEPAVSLADQAPALPAEPPAAPAAPTVPPTKPVKARAETLPIPPDLDSPAFDAAWRDWIRFRRGRRHPCDCDTMARQLESLAPLGAARATDCLKSSLTNGYQGIFPEKFSGASGGTSRARVGPGQTYDPNAKAKDPNHGRM